MGSRNVTSPTAAPASSAVLRSFHGRGLIVVVCSGLESLLPLYVRPCLLHDGGNLWFLLARTAVVCIMRVVPTRSDDPAEWLGEQQACPSSPPIHGCVPMYRSLAGGIFGQSWTPTANRSCLPDSRETCRVAWVHSDGEEAWGRQYIKHPEWAWHHEEQGWLWGGHVGESEPKGGRTR